ncbi:radical SAM protein [Candidatus Parcubacteria bacterium]|jgi:MoaA/NifB/PqqE/SkfB family radical SAM enzyme|nr:radical SAM protein [Candidatus Parcubacteria bacterium]MBT3949430.1 radical SAM protein [Candidatus Parcubacteria bacterium]
MNVKRFKKYSVLALKKIINHIRTEIFLRTGKWMPRPMKIYYLLTNKCNYKCIMCPQWECGIKENPKDYIGEDEMKRIIDEASRMGIYEFGVSGGETLIYHKKMFNLLEYANKKGLYTHFVTNGALLSKDYIQKYNDMGGGHISLSIDAIGDKHDELRGMPGAYGAIENVLKIFKENSFPNILLKINTVLSGGNFDYIIDVLKLAIENNSVIFVQPYDVYDYDKKLDSDEKEEKFSLWVKKEQQEKLKQVIDKMIELKKKHPQIILNEEKHIRAMYGYFVKCKVDQTCFAGMDNVSIMPNGKVSFCKYGEYSDLKEQSLKEFLNSKKRKEVVRDSLKCKHGCLLSCMFRPSLGEMLTSGPKQFLKLVKSK